MMRRGELPERMLAFRALISIRWVLEIKKDQESVRNRSRKG